jgi:hypothetical protein
MKQSQILAMNARRRREGLPVYGSKAARLAAIREEARIDRMAEDSYRERKQDQRDEHEARIARQRDESWS